MTGLTYNPLGHVNNVVYNRYAESGRVEWTRNFAAIDPEHKQFWNELCTPKTQGLILRSIKTDFKFVGVLNPDNLGAVVADKHFHSR